MSCCQLLESQRLARVVAFLLHRRRSSSAGTGDFSHASPPLTCAGCAASGDPPSSLSFGVPSVRQSGVLVGKGPFHSLRHHRAQEGQRPASVIHFAEGVTHDAEKWGEPDFLLCRGGTRRYGTSLALRAVFLLDVCAPGKRTSAHLSHRRRKEPRFRPPPFSAWQREKRRKKGGKTARNAPNRRRNASLFPSPTSPAAHHWQTTIFAD